MSSNHTYEEKELLTLIAAGNEAAFEQLFFLYKDRIYAIAFRLSMSSALAEDMVQDVFLKVWLNRDKLADVTHFRAYLFTLARHHIVRYLKQLARNAFVPSGETDAITMAGADISLLEKEYVAILEEAVQRLAPQQAQVYRLSKQEGLKREEIARQLGVSPETVKAHLAQAMKHIRAFCIARLDILLLVILLGK